MDTKRDTYLFPSNVTRSNLLKLIRSCEDPSFSKYMFKEHPAVYKKTVMTIEEAEKLIEKAIETDNFDVSDNDEVSEDGII